MVVQRVEETNMASKYGRITSSIWSRNRGGFVPYFVAMGGDDVTIQNMAQNMAPRSCWQNEPKVLYLYTATVWYSQSASPSCPSTYLLLPGVDGGSQPQRVYHPNSTNSTSLYTIQKQTQCLHFTGKFSPLQHMKVRCSCPPSSTSRCTLWVLVLSMERQDDGRQITSVLGFGT